MLKCEELYETFKNEGLTFFSGVPDSTFKDWMKFLNDEHGSKVTNIIAANECEATSICAGYHLGSGKPGVVYMQNSGLGKTINPITSLVDPEVYSIPMLLMIGWRGEPGKKDEPQHIKMGKVMIPILDSLDIPHCVLEEDIDKASTQIKEAKEYIEKNNAPYAIIIKKGTFEEYESKKKAETDFEMNREDAIKATVDNLEGDEAIVSTTGKTSRELYDYRKEKGEKSSDFYTVGSMGCSAAIALGIAIEKKDKKVFVFDGDGAVIMQMGTLATIGNYKPKNLYHIVFDNQAYDSTGGQPTVSNTVDFVKVALSCGYSKAEQVETKDELVKAVSSMKDTDGPYLLAVKVNKGARKDLGRPTSKPVENKKEFMDQL